MEAQLVQIREQQKAAWNKFAPGWRKWDAFTMDFLKPMGDEIIRSLQLTHTDHVLDVAAGTGEPGLTIASIVKQGHVVITDLAEGMLEVAHDHAIQKGITNFETVACDVCELPFREATFEAVSCRFGFMFFPDMLLAAKEMARVLKPGGRLSASVWSVPEKNGWITITMNVLNKHLPMPTPPPGALGMFRCGSPGFLAGLFKQAGLKHVTETEVTGHAPFGSSNAYWGFMTDVVAPVVAALGQVDAAMKETFKKEVMHWVDQKYPDKKAALEYDALVITGQKKPARRYGVLKKSGKIAFVSAANNP